MKNIILFLIFTQISFSQSYLNKKDFNNNSKSQYGDEKSTFPQPFKEIINNFW